MGLTPNPPLDDGDASDVGRPPFGAALYSRLSAAREARDRSSPSRVTIADAFLPPPARRPAGGMARPPAKLTSRSAPYESPRFHPPRQQARRRARQARPRRNRRRHRPQEPRPRQSVRPPRSHRRRCPQRCRRALPRKIPGRPQIRWPDERRDRSPHRTRPKGRAPGLHVLVLAEALPRRHHHRRDQTAPRMRRRTTRRSRKARTPLLAILSWPALSSPNVAAEMDQAAALQARGKSPERTLVGPRDQVRRLPHRRSDRSRRRPATYPFRARLDRQVSRHRRRARDTESRIRLSRRRALRRSPGRRDLLRAHAASLRSRRRRSRLFRLRSSRSRRRRPRRPAPPRPQGTPRGPPREAAGRNRIQRP